MTPDDGPGDFDWETIVEELERDRLDWELCRADWRFMNYADGYLPGRWDR